MQKIIEEFMKLVDGGDEAAAKTFLADHINEFPEDVQKKITAAFFWDALAQKSDEIEQRAAVQKALLAEFADLEKAEKQLGDARKAEEIKSDLKN
ncbi:MAG: hypothetical protein KGJ35_03370 [Patescibacteria group bacterium]|nr:hypothetical protein [Patescibacteria group bacterium]